MNRCSTWTVLWLLPIREANIGYIAGGVTYLPYFITHLTLAPIRTNMPNSNQCLCGVWSNSNLFVNFRSRLHIFSSHNIQISISWNTPVSYLCQQCIDNMLKIEIVTVISILYTMFLVFTKFFISYFFIILPHNN